jgi:hypothetical protein
MGGKMSDRECKLACTKGGMAQTPPLFKKSPFHRSAVALLPARRNAAHPEQARELGDASDRNSRLNGEGQGEPAATHKL